MFRGVLTLFSQFSFRVGLPVFRAPDGPMVLSSDSGARWIFISWPNELKICGSVPNLFSSLCKNFIIFGVDLLGFLINTFWGVSLWTPNGPVLNHRMVWWFKVAPIELQFSVVVSYHLVICWEFLWDIWCFSWMVFIIFFVALCDWNLQFSVGSSFGVISLGRLSMSLGRLSMCFHFAWCVSSQWTELSAG